MVRNAVSQDLEQAKAAGWTWLNTACPHCSHRAQVQLSDIEWATRLRNLTRVVNAMTCRQCGRTGPHVGLGRYKAKSGSLRVLSQDLLFTEAFAFWR